MLALLLMAPQQGGGEQSFLPTVIMFGSIIAIFYFMILRPQQKRQKERQKLLESMKKGDKIVTAGGVHGTIVGLEDKTALIQIAENVKIKIERSSIAVVNKVGEVEGVESQA
ncbi:MAG: preprotein translocase subunit YajC [Ignavibacteriales bacterium]|nr:preprotein translocase subunit YajC [Ignavibacteriales bacterium]